MRPEETIYVGDAVSDVGKREWCCVVLCWGVCACLTDVLCDSDGKTGRFLFGGITMRDGTRGINSCTSPLLS